MGMDPGGICGDGAARRAPSPPHPARGLIPFQLPQHPHAVCNTVNKGGWWIITGFPNPTVSPSAAGPSNDHPRSCCRGRNCFAPPPDFGSPAKEPTPRETTETTCPTELTKGVRRGWETGFGCLRPPSAPLMLGLSNAMSAGMDTSREPQGTPLTPAKSRGGCFSRAYGAHEVNRHEACV